MEHGSRRRFQKANPINRPPRDLHHLIDGRSGILERGGARIESSQLAVARQTGGEVDRKPRQILQRRGQFATIEPPRGTSAERSLFAFNPGENPFLFRSARLRPIFRRHLVGGKLFVNHRPQISVSDVKTVDLVVTNPRLLLLRSVTSVAMSLKEWRDGRLKIILGGAGRDGQGK
nr:hypothetical protein [Lignipirellula cremea]